MVNNTNATDKSCCDAHAKTATGDREHHNRGVNVNIADQAKVCRNSSCLSVCSQFVGSWSSHLHHALFQFGSSNTGSRHVTIRLSSFFLPFSHFFSPFFLNKIVFHVFPMFLSFLTFSHLLFLLFFLFFFVLKKFLHSFFLFCFTIVFVLFSFVFFVVLFYCSFFDCSFLFSFFVFFFCFPFLL